MTSRMLYLVWRACLGAFAGAVFGLVLCAFLGDASYYPPDHGFGPLLQSMAAGASLGTVLGVFAGSWEIRGKLKSAILGVIAGAFLGAIAGYSYGAHLCQSGDELIRA